MFVYKNLSDLPLRPLLTASSADSKGSFTFEYGSVARIELKLPRMILPREASLSVYSDGEGKTSLYPLSYVGDEGLYRIYTLDLDTAHLCGKENSGLFYLTFGVRCAYGNIYVSDGGYEGNTFVGNKEKAAAFQVTVYSPNIKAPEFIKGGIIYHIFVDRFAKGSVPIPKRSDAVYAEWGSDICQYPSSPGQPVENNLFYGGDLWGAAEKLPYIASLGVNCVYLSPVFEAYSNHKYDTADYTRADASFGGDEALKNFVSEAKKYGIGVILDGVFNHTGYKSRYFNGEGRYPDPGAYESKTSPYYGWYTFDDYPDGYKCWWGVKILPTVKSDEPSYLDYVCGKDGIAERWMDIGIKGFRLDVADELSDRFLTEFRKAVKGKDGESYLVGEVWEDASDKIAYGRRRKYFRGRQLDSVMNYPLKDAIVSYLKRRDARPLAAALFRIYRNYPPFARDSLMNILGTHDTERILTALGGRPVDDRENSALAHAKMTAEEREKGKALLKIAYLILTFAPGVPCIFYGDEAGVEGYGDPFNRVCYPWGKEDADLLEYYRSLGRVRRGCDVLKDGLLEISEWENGRFAFSRYKDGKSVTVCVNLSDSPHRFFIGGEYLSLLTGKRGDTCLDVPPESGDAVIRLSPDTKKTPS